VPDAFQVDANYNLHVGTSSEWISASIEALLVGGALVALKVFHKNDRKVRLKLTVMDVLGCMLAGLIFGVFTTFRLTEVRWKRIFVSLSFCSFKISLLNVCTVLIFFIAGLLFAPRARRSLGAYRIPLETGLLIPSD
jgi:hypothetical protein